MKGFLMFSGKAVFLSLVVISLLAGCGGGGGSSGGGFSGGGGTGGGINPVAPVSTTGPLTATTSVPAGTDGATNGVLAGFTANALAPGGNTLTTTTGSSGAADFGSQDAGNYLLAVYNPAYPSTVLLGLESVTPSKGEVKDVKDGIVINTQTTTAALVALRYKQADSGTIAGMEISVLLRIASAGTNARFEAVRARLEQYLTAHTAFFNVSTMTITDQALQTDVDAARNSITMVIDSFPYRYQKGVANPITLYSTFNHAMTNLPPQNTTYTVVHRTTSGQAATINSTNYQAYGSWDCTSTIMRFKLSVTGQSGATESFDWSFATMPAAGDSSAPLETDTAGHTNTQIFYMK